MAHDIKKQENKSKQSINKFISSVSDKNYATAHKYLQDVVEDKVLKRIDRATEKPLF